MQQQAMQKATEAAISAAAAVAATVQSAAQTSIASLQPPSAPSLARAEQASAKVEESIDYDELPEELCKSLSTLKNKYVRKVRQTKKVHSRNVRLGLEVKLMREDKVFKKLPNSSLAAGLR